MIVVTDMYFVRHQADDMTFDMKEIHFVIKTQCQFFVILLVLKTSMIELLIFGLRMCTHVN